MRVGLIGGVEAQLVGVTVDNFVHVLLTTAPGVERDRLDAEHADAFGRWAATARETREDAPEQPGTRLMQVRVTVTDDVGGDYDFATGQAGGSGSEWQAMQSFRPRPPVGVRELRLTLRSPEEPDGLSMVVPVDTADLSSD